MTLNRLALRSGTTLLLSLSAIAAHAQPCTDRTLSGGYSYQVVGQTGTEAPFQPFVSQRLVTFDGAGSLSGSGYRILAGDVAKSPITGTYSVQPDCSVSFEITVFREDGSVVHVDQVFGVVTESGLRVHGALVSIVAPATLTVQFEKVSQRLSSKSAPSD
jgi:hypothetical protein